VTEAYNAVRQPPNFDLFRGSNLGVGFRRYLAAFRPKNHTRPVPQFLENTGIDRHLLTECFINESAFSQLKLNPLNLTDCDLIFGPVVELGCSRRLMRGHLLGMLQPAVVLQVNCDASCPPGMAADAGEKTRILSPLTPRHCSGLELVPSRPSQTKFTLWNRSCRGSAQEFKRIGRLCVNGFPERWVIILWAVYSRRNFPHPHMIGRVGSSDSFKFPSSVSPNQAA
jgi:hypothetical protein